MLEVSTVTADRGAALITNTMHINSSLRHTLRIITSALNIPVLGLLVLSIFAVSALFSGLFYSTADAQSTGFSNYCRTTYDVEADRILCQDGWDGKDCSEALFYSDERGMAICEKSAAAKSRGETGATPPKNEGTDPKPDPQPGKDESDLVDDITDGKSGDGAGDDEQLTKLIDTLKEINKLTQNEKDWVDADEKADNNYGQYINGAGNLQPIRITKGGGDNSPAIIFFNGGGWHTDSGMGDKVAPHAVERGYSAFVATYRLGSSGIYYMLEDVMRAIRHVRNNAQMYGIDASRVAIWGDSAGGHLTMRAAGTGKSGARAAVGWSAPTNAYTAIFHSAQSFAIGMDHSTCAPTDLDGVNSIVDQLNGGDGDVNYDGDIGNNNIGGGANLDTVINVLELANEAQKTSKSIEEVSKSMEEGGDEMGENVRRLASKKVIECIDNFNSGSPALFASALTPPTLLAGYEADPLIHPGQAYQMRDKLRSMGIQSEALILPGDRHMGYEEEMVAPSLDFVDRYLQP